MSLAKSISSSFVFWKFLRRSSIIRCLESIFKFFTSYWEGLETKEQQQIKLLGLQRLRGLLICCISTGAELRSLDETAFAHSTRIISVKQNKMAVTRKPSSLWNRSFALFSEDLSLFLKLLRVASTCSNTCRRFSLISATLSWNLLSTACSVFS